MFMLIVVISSRLVLIEVFDGLILLIGILMMQVFPYGSVPLKTYLPDGDIDLTIIRSPNIKGSLAHEILAVLKGEEQNENAEYEVKDTLLIDAEVVSNQIFNDSFVDGPEDIFTCQTYITVIPLVLYFLSTAESYSF